MHKRYGYYKDISKKYVLPEVLKGTTIIIMGVLIYALIVWVTGYGIAYSNRKYNEYAKAFNELSSEERTIVKPFMADQYEIDEETGLLPIKECGEMISFLAYLRENNRTIIGIILLLYSILVFYCYLKVRDKKYHFADVPIRNPYCFFLLISMFAVWPILLIGRVHMYIKSLPTVKVEKEALYKQALEEAQKELLLEATEPKIKGLASLKAEIAYINYIVSRRERIRKTRIAEIDVGIADVEQELKRCASSIREYQQRKSCFLAERKRLENAETSEQAHDRALREWTTIRDMRGVTSFRAEERCLAIKVDVRVPYDGELYDFGDYLIKLYPHDYSCERLRSGKRLDATSDAPNYYNGSSFCFGDRHSLIQKYIEKAQYVEALTVMIDSLHSVNGPDVEREIPNCFRKAKKFERAKRRLKKKLANEASKGGVTCN